MRLAMRLITLRLAMRLITLVFERSAKNTVRKQQAAAGRSLSTTQHGERNMVNATWSTTKTWATHKRNHRETIDDGPQRSSRRSKPGCTTKQAQHTFQRQDKITSQGIRTRNPQRTRQAPDTHNVPGTPYKAPHDGDVQEQDVQEQGAHNKAPTKPFPKGQSPSQPDHHH